MSEASKPYGRALTLHGSEREGVSDSGDPGLTLVKLGGALLTEKDGVEAARLDVLERLVTEIAAWEGASGRLILGHGSGSYAHVAVRDSGFLDRPGDPQAFARVAAAASRLNALVVNGLMRAGLPAIALPGSLLGVCEGGRVVEVRAELVSDLLDAGLLPTLYGDAAPDRAQGGAVASTEPLLIGLADRLKVRRIIVATDVDGVFEGDPNERPDARPIPLIRPDDRAALARHLGSARSGAVDVTGGMSSKVALMLDLVERRPEIEVRILSGLRTGALLAALRAEAGAGAGAEAEAEAEAGGTRIVAANSSG